jgi:hypothetical protein
MTVACAYERGMAVVLPQVLMAHPTGVGRALTTYVIPIEGRSAEAPEVSRESEAVEDRLVLLAGVGSPVGRKAVAPPSVGELTQLLDRQRDAGRASRQPGSDVGFRPEDEHGPSGEADVLPPLARGDKDMPDEVGRLGLSVLHIDPDRRMAVTAFGLDHRVDAEGGTDAEPVPAAVRVPAPASRLDTECGGDRRERVKHANAAAVIEDERVSVMQPPPPGFDLRLVGPRRRCDLPRRRGAPELDHPEVRQVSQLDVAGLHGGIVTAPWAV